MTVGGSPVQGGIGRRQFVKLVVAPIAAAQLPLLDCLAAEAGVHEKPNIILVMADDLGYGDLSCYGNTEIHTPHIDALARGGLTFTDYHSNCPVCSPTRAALLTGRYQHRSGIHGVVYANGPARQTGMAQKEITFAEVLKKAGYATGIFGKWHLGYSVEFSPTKQGFDEFIGYVSGNVDFHSHIDGAGFHDWWKNDEEAPEDGYVTDLITKHAVDFIERHKDEPFCLYLPHEAPHSPYQGREDPPQRLPDGEKSAKAKVSQIKRAYKEMVEVMDEGVGEVLRAVRRLGLERRTFIFFCSDNGATKNGSNGPLAGYKGSLWEGGHRVPAVAYWPGKIKPASVTDQTVVGMDLFPTMLALAGVRPPKGVVFDGVDLSGVLLNGKRIRQRTLFWAYNQQRAVRKGPWKLLVGEGKTQLFNLKQDLGERRDLAASNPAMVKTLGKELAAWEEDVGPATESPS